MGHEDAAPRFRELNELFALLIEDVAAILKILATDKAQVWRRSLVRAFFALVEGTTWHLKASALQHPRAEETLRLAERALLREESYAISDKGTPRVRPKFMGTAENLRFVLGVYARLDNQGFAPDYAGPGWRAFQAALEVRNRITHPKGAAACEVSTDELRWLAEALAWYESTLSELSRASERAARG